MRLVKDKLQMSLDLIKKKDCFVERLKPKLKEYTRTQ